MVNDIEYIQAVKLAAGLNETICLILQAYDKGTEVTPEMVEKVRTIHALANQMLGLDADA